MIGSLVPLLSAGGGHRLIIVFSSLIFLTTILEAQTTTGESSPDVEIRIRANERVEGGRTVFSDTQFFPILPWGPFPDRDMPGTDEESGLASMAECHFTMAAFVNPAFLSLCEDLGLKAIVHPTIAGLGTWGRAWSELSDEEIEERVRALVEEAGDSEAVIGYYLRDEPSMLDFPALAKAVAAVEKHAPGKIAYINLFPDYAVLGDRDISRLGTSNYTEYVERFVAEVKPHILSYDNYSVLYAQDLSDTGRAASYYRNLLEIRRIALENDLPFWNIVSANQIRPFTPIPSPANLAFQAYTTLAAGGRGISWYTYYARSYGYAPIDDSGKRTQTWYSLKEINRQIEVLGPMMNRLRSTGVFFTLAAPAEGLPVLPGRVIQSATSESPLMIGEFKGDDDSDYVMMVNLSLEKSANVRFETYQSNRPAEIISSVDGRPVPFDAENGYWLTAGHGVLLRLR